MNCWEFMKCPEDTFSRCPAYPSYGLDCWKVTGTKCNMGKYEKSSIKEKIAHCKGCNFYNQFAHKF